jgi:hypothetical protein
MKFTTIALAAGFALFSTSALANTGHRQSVVRTTHRGTVGMVQPYPDYGNPDGPGKGYAIPGWTDEQTRYWIDNATGPKD